jgi:hypothetical protein
MQAEKTELFFLELYGVSLFIAMMSLILYYRYGFRLKRSEQFPLRHSVNITITHKLESASIRP